MEFTSLVLNGGTVLLITVADPGSDRMESGPRSNPRKIGITVVLS